MEKTPSGNQEAEKTEQVWTVQKILNWTTEYLQQRNCESPRLESEVLLAHARGCQRIELYTDYNAPVDEPVRSTMRTLVQRRANGEPVAYLVGHREFFSLDFRLEPGVFIPRPETETLVLEAIEKLKPIRSPRILELCAGSGCISVSLAVQRPDAEITTVELHSLAYQTAVENVNRHDVSHSVKVLQGDLFEPLGDPPETDSQKYDLLISNPPYLCTSEIPELDTDVRDYEPHAALDGGEDGLDLIRVILERGPRYIKPEGWCLLEMDPAQISPCLELAKNSGKWSLHESIKDLNGEDRCLLLQRGGP